MQLKLLILLQEVLQNAPRIIKNPHDANGQVITDDFSENNGTVGVTFSVDKCIKYNYT